MCQDYAWSAADIEDEVCSILARVLDKPLGSIQADAPLDEGLGVDSLALIETQVGIEERFGVAMPDVDESATEAPHTVNDLVRTVAARLQGGWQDA